MKMLKTLFLVSTVALFYACGSGQKSESEASETDESASTEMQETETEEPVDQMAQATAELSQANESGLTGTATFTDVGDGKINVKVTLANVSPGKHAVHIHEKGDCSAPDATSAGGHWNPGNTKHGHRGVDAEYHAGDIENLEAGEDGTGTLEMTVEGWTIGGADSTNIIGHAVIVHDGADDFTSQPSGAAGKRIGCGVIQ